MVLTSCKGNDGKSAYDIAVEHGFVGTEGEWLESLIGAQGVGIADISVVIKYDSFGIKYFVFTFTYTDETTKVLEVAEEGVEDVIIPDEPETESGAFEIATVGELRTFATLVNEGNTFKGKTVLITADIDLENEEWIPIGTSTNKFQGTFDGNGYTISNLYINNPTV